MQPSDYLTNLGADLKSYSDDNSGNIEQTINFGGTPEELSSRDGIRRNVACLRYAPGTFEVPVGPNKPSEWHPAIEMMLYVETAGGKRDRVYGYDELLTMLKTCFEWQDQVDAAADIHADMADFYLVSNGAVIDDRPKYYAMTITFNATICLL